jgi:DNA-binding CsgD family transcriptional regulator
MPNPQPDELSERELGILKLVATGASNKEIARKLFISSNTVKVHLRNIFTKIGVASRTEAAMYAVRTGLIETEKVEILTQDAALQNLDDFGLPVDSTQLSNPSLDKPINKKKRYIRYFGLFGFIIIFLSFLGVIYSRNNIIPTETLVPTTPTPRIQWFELPGLPTPRSGLAVTSYENQIYAIGGASAQGVSNALEMYDTQTKTWIDLASKPISVKDVMAGVIGGIIYVPGGRMINGEPTAITEIYDPKSSQWSLGAPLPKPLAAYGLAVSEGRIYIFGGWDGKKIVNDAYEYDTQNNTWAELTPMPTARSYPGVVVVGRKIYVVGGWDGQKALTSNEIYMPDAPTATSQWTVGPLLPSGRYGMGITNLADIIFVIGGTNPNDELTMISLEQNDKEWMKLVTPLEQGWSFLGAVTVGSHLYALGGQTEAGYYSKMWSYQAIFTITLPIVR